MIQMTEVNSKWPSLPIRMKTMLSMYGRGPFDEKCQSCTHLVYHRQATSWMKCDLQRNTGPAGDWRARWPACGKYEEAGTFLGEQL